MEAGNAISMLEAQVMAERRDKAVGRDETKVASDHALGLAKTTLSNL